MSCRLGRGLHPANSLDPGTGIRTRLQEAVKLSWGNRHPHQRLLGYEVVGPVQVTQEWFAQLTGHPHLVRSAARKPFGQVCCLDAGSFVIGSNVIAYGGRQSADLGQDESHRAQLLEQGIKLTSPLDLAAQGGLHFRGLNRHGRKARTQGSRRSSPQLDVVSDRPVRLSHNGIHHGATVHAAVRQCVTLRG